MASLGMAAGGKQKTQNLLIAHNEASSPVERVYERKENTDFREDEMNR